MKNTCIKAFNFIEILIVITILALISVIAYTSFGLRQNNTINTKIQSEISTLSNALLSYKQENNLLPQPEWNTNFYSEDTSYVHDYQDDITFWVHWFITHDTVPKKYIDIVPVDPRTGSFYAYGKTKLQWNTTESYEISWVIFDWDTYESIVVWDYTAESWPFNLIREYNGPNFVYNKSKNNFPYNPLERILTAKIYNFSWKVLINNQLYSAEKILNYELKSWDTIEVDQNWIVELYYSDWSQSILWDKSHKTIITLQKMDFIQKNNLVTDIKLILESGMIWTKAAKLDQESWFEIFTTDSTAAVRWTIFWVQKDEQWSTITVKNGNVAIKEISWNHVINTEIIKEYITDNIEIPSEVIDDVNEVIEFNPNNESIIQVEENENIKWIFISRIEKISSLESLDDIPSQIINQILYNAPVINNNIQIKLNNYFYTEENVSISIDITENLLNNSDFLIINQSDIIEIDSSNNISQSWSIITYTFDSISDNVITNSYSNSDFISDNIWINNNFIINSEINSDIINPEWRINSTEINLLEYIINKIENWEEQITLQLWKLNHNNKISLTNKIYLTIIQNKYYTNRSDELYQINEADIIQEKEENIVTNRLNNNCNWFIYSWICADANNELKTQWWNLIAYAPYDNITFEPDIQSQENLNTIYWFHTARWNINVHLWSDVLIKSSWSSCIPHFIDWKYEDNYCESWNSRENLNINSMIFNRYSHILNDNIETWVFIDNYGDDSKLKYELDEWLRSLNNYLIEFSIRWWALKRTTWNYYLYNNNNVELFLSGWDLRLKINGSIGDKQIKKEDINNIIIDNNKYYNIQIISNEGQIKLKIDNHSTEWSSNEWIILNRYQYIWLRSSHTDNQWNDIINYIKIYDL